MPASEGFRIPLAYDPAGRLVAPEKAARRTRYVCPSCRADVVLHAGNIKRRHFHHRSSACSAESVLHLSAKRLIVQAIEDWRNGGAPVSFLRRCQEPDCEAQTHQHLPKKVLRAVEEWPLRSGHVVDVALLGLADLPIAAIEIVVTHAVDDRKAFELGIPWIEVDGAAVCASDGRLLVPVQDGFIPWLCSMHTHRRGVSWREDRERERDTRALVRALPFTPKDFPAYRIAGTTVCPRGHPTVVFAWDGSDPPWPRPPSVIAIESDDDTLYDRTNKALRRTLPFRRHWTNACTTCGERINTPA